MQLTQIFFYFLATLDRFGRVRRTADVALSGPVECRNILTELVLLD
jgi:hypothetical protein